MDTYIKRIDLTRDYEAHREEYLKAIEKVCRETAFSGGKYADAFDRDFAEYVGVPMPAASTTALPRCILPCWLSVWDPGTR